MKVEKSQALSDNLRKIKLDQKSIKLYGVMTVQGSSPSSFGK
jgi:hypothetical protein